MSEPNQDALPGTLSDMFADSLKRRAKVEQYLWDVAGGKRPPPTPEECGELARQLGIPKEWLELRDQ